jgi:hypothetical protein
MFTVKKNEVLSISKDIRIKQKTKTHIYKEGRFYESRFAKSHQGLSLKEQKGGWRGRCGK